MIGEDRQGPVMLCILDGWGLAPPGPGNAVALGQTPNFDRIWANYPRTQLSASGIDVGLPAGVMGNSEVGHLNIGAGRIVWQDSSMIDQSIAEGSFFTNETLRSVMHHARDQGTRLHLLGLVSDGNVHSSEGHYFALLEMAAREGLCADQVLVHVFTDGRDTPPHSGYGHVARLLAEMVRTGVGAVASVVGRYYAMDRDRRWHRVQHAYECLTEGQGRQAADALAAIGAAYDRGETDEFILPTAICDSSGQVRPRISENDAVLFFNYRSDRGRQLTRLLIDPEFGKDAAGPPPPGMSEEEASRREFVRRVWPRVHFATMTRYAAEYACPIAFEPRPQRMGIGEWAAAHGLTQLRSAETEKYPHVTYFFSGGLETPWEGEERILVASPQVPTYDLQPEMSAPELTEKVTAAIRSGRFGLIILNFANPDMVGHTGSLPAAIQAVETVDCCLGEVLKALEDTRGALLVIADHGNCEQMIDPVSGGPHTAHTTNPVPCILVQGEPQPGAQLRSGGRLADIAPTLLGLLGLPRPDEMTGVDLRQGAAQQLVEAAVDDASDLLPRQVALRDCLTRLERSCLFYVHAGFALEQLPEVQNDALRGTLRTMALEHENARRRWQDELPRTGAAAGENIAPPCLNTALTGNEVAGAAGMLEREAAAAAQALAAGANDEPSREIYLQLADECAVWASRWEPLHPIPVQLGGTAGQPDAGPSGEVANG